MCPQSCHYKSIDIHLAKGGLEKFLITGGVGRGAEAAQKCRDEGEPRGPSPHSGRPRIRHSPKRICLLPDLPCPSLRLRATGALPASRDTPPSNRPGAGGRSSPPPVACSHALRDRSFAHPRDDSRQTPLRCAHREKRRGTRKIGEPSGKFARRQMRHIGKTIAQDGNGSCRADDPRITTTQSWRHQDTPARRA